MAFVWNPIPTPPAPIVPVPVPPGEVTYKVASVANNVNYGGVLRYNTANKSYDIIYEFPSLNVKVGVFENGFFESANIGHATLNVANIQQANINTANIVNATITFGYVTGSPSANMGIASKFYVDNAVAAISGGAGPDSTANLFITTGDLLVGFAPNTAHKLNVGTQGQTLTVNTSSSVKQSWKDIAGSQRATGVFISTHWHPTKKSSQVLLKHADGMVMNDGEYVTGWDNLVADIATTGAGGLDSNSVEAPSSWYEVWAIRNSTSGAKALLLHRMLDRIGDANWPATSQSLAYLRRGDAALTIPDMRYCTKVSQSFVSTRSLKLATIDLKLQKISNPTGNLWISVQGDDGLGNADGGVICTSDRISITPVPGSSITTRFTFDTGATLSSGGRYHLVAEGDWPYQVDTLDANSIAFVGNTAPLGPGQQNWMANVGYTSGNLTINSGYGDCRIWNVVTSTWKVAANASGVGISPSDLWFAINLEENSTALALPSGYNQKCLISYVCNDASSNFKEYHQHNRTISQGFESAWKTYNEGTQPAGLVPVDLSGALPPTPVVAKLLVFSLYTGLSGTVIFASRFSYDLSLSLTDVSSRGIYTVVPGGNKLGLSDIIAVDGWNFMYASSLGVGASFDTFIYGSSFTF